MTYSQERGELDLTIKALMARCKFVSVRVRGERGRVR
jgi:hypothetical protein